MGLWCLLIFIEVSLAAAAASAAATPGESLRYDEPKSRQLLRLPMASFPQTEPPCYQPIDTVGSLLFRGLPANRNNKGMPVLCFVIKRKPVSDSLVFTAICNRFPQPEKRMNVCAFFFFPFECGRHGTGSANIGASHTWRKKTRVHIFSFSHLLPAEPVFGFSRRQANKNIQIN